MRRHITIFLLAVFLLPMTSFAQKTQVDSSDYSNPYKIHNSLYEFFQRAQKNRSDVKCLAIADSMTVYAKKLGDKKAECIALTVPLTYYCGIKDIDKAEFCTEELKAKALETGYIQYYYAYQSLISLLLTKSEYIDAKQLLDELEAYVTDKNDSYGKSICYVAMGHFYHQRLNYELAIKSERYEDALDYSERGLKCFSSSSAKLTLLDHKATALFFLRRNDDFVKAYREFDKAHNQIMAEDLAGMGARYDNVNLRAENAELELSQEKMRSRTILKSHGGSVGASDKPDGKGASTWLEFPLSAK